MRARLVLVPGWPAGVAAPVVAAASTVITIHAAVSLDWLVARIGVVAVSLLAIGVAVGSERLAATAVVPGLAGLVIGAGSPDRVAGVAALTIGCGWFLALELALASIERRSGAVPTAAARAVRRREVATVLVVALVVGGTGMALATTVPERSLTVRAAIAAAVVLAAWAVHRRVAAGAVSRGDAGALSRVVAQAGEPPTGSSGGPR
ncbi:MAG: hypothetical protein ACFCVK_24550 [Acidimicrobiales bacterium]